MGIFHSHSEVYSIHNSSRTGGGPFSGSKTSGYSAATRMGSIATPYLSTTNIVARYALFPLYTNYSTWVMEMIGTLGYPFPWRTSHEHKGSHTTLGVMLTIPWKESPCSTSITFLGL